MMSSSLPHCKDIAVLRTANRIKACKQHLLIYGVSECYIKYVFHEMEGFEIPIKNAACNYSAIYFMFEEFFGPFYIGLLICIKNTFSTPF